jgi:biotin-dependent carboxylase-like uncharacterized protein
MPTLLVVDPGPMTTIQDLGRVGAQRLGIPPSGAMDRPSMVLANRLVGNDPNAACLEATVRGPELQMIKETCVAVTGGQASPRLNSHPMPMWTAVCVAPGDRIVVGTAVKGCRLYLSVAGGINVPIVLGSRSTYVRGRLGGLEGRSLRHGDLIAAGPSHLPLEKLAGQSVTSQAAPFGEMTLRVILGPQDHAFTPEGLRSFFSEPYRITPHSDRMGCRLTGPFIQHARGHDIISDGTAWGSIQVAGDGQPIILLADRPTTGGYPKIATVISVDLSSVAQARPGEHVRFQAVGLEEAQRLLREQEAELASALPIQGLP